MTGNLRWRTDRSSGLQIAQPDFLTKTAAYTMTIDDQVILGDASGGAFSITLPAATAALRDNYVIKNTGSSGTVTIAAAGSDTIDGAATQPLANQYDSLILAGDGSTWHIIGKVT